MLPFTLHFFPLHFPQNTRSRAPPEKGQQVMSSSVTCVLYNDPVVPLYGSPVRVGAMAKEDHQTNGGKSFLSDNRSQIIVLGVIVAVVVVIWQIFPALWKDPGTPIFLIAVGLGMPVLFSLWNYWIGYGWQVGIAPGLAFLLMGIFTWLFGYDVEELWADAVLNLLLTNLVVLGIWLILVFFAFRNRSKRETNQHQDNKHNKKNAQQDYRRGEVWRDYRWIIAPAVIILLFLFDTSWAQSTLSTSSLKKSDINATPPDSFRVHAEYPHRIFFDDVEPSEIRLWITGTVNCVELEISADGLVFAVKPPSDEPLQWSDKLTLKFNGTTTAITLLVQPSKPPEIDSQTVQLNLDDGGKNLETSDWEMLVESKQDSQIRGWKTNFLDAGSTIVSLITAVFVGVKQLEEEKKRQKAEQIKQSLSAFDAEVKKDFLEALKKQRNLAADWNEWDKHLQDQFRNKYTSFVEKDLWEVIATTTQDKVEIINLLCQIVEKIFEDKESKPISTIRQLQAALQNDARALLSMLREYPESIGVAKQIARNLPDDLKNEIPVRYIKEFQQEIILLKEELGFSDTESFPLQSQFRFYTVPYQAEARLAAWLERQGLRCSPFADALSPYTSMPGDEKLLIEQVSAGFSLPTFERSTQNFPFANCWDAGAALFEYVRNLPQRIKNETFVTTLTPSMIADFGVEQPRHLLLHALAEGWYWTLADAPALYYSLGKSQLTLAGRLLRWHGGSSSAIVRNLEQTLGWKKEEKGTQKFIEDVSAWLENTESADLRKEEIPALLQLRPSSRQQFTLALVSAVDWDFAASIAMPPAVHEALDGEAEWLQAHGWRLVHFMISDVNPQQIAEEKLEQQCQRRVQICSNGPLEALERLFNPHSEAPADLILARKAAGSPGKMVRLGQKLLLQHAAKYPPDKLLHIEDLLALA